MIKMVIPAMINITMGSAMVNEVRKKPKHRNPYKKNYRRGMKGGRK